MFLSQLVSPVAQQLLCACTAGGVHAVFNCYAPTIIQTYGTPSLSFGTFRTVFHTRLVLIFVGQVSQRFMGIGTVMKQECGSVIFSAVVPSDAFFYPFQKNGVFPIKKWLKVWQFQEYCLLLRSELEQTEKNGYDEDSNG